MVPGSPEADEQEVGESVTIPPLEGWIVASDAAEVLGLSRQSINKKIKSGVFSGARTIGKQYVLPEKDVEAERERRADMSVDEILDE